MAEALQISGQSDVSKGPDPASKAEIMNTAKNFSQIHFSEGIDITN